MAKRGRGQPSKYRPEFCELLIKHMSEGMAFQTFGATLNPPCSRAVLYVWEAEHPEFKAAKQIGLDASELFWDKIGTAGIAGRIKGFNASAWIFTRKNRHGWRDHVEITGAEEDRSLVGLKFLEPDPQE